MTQDLDALPLPEPTYHEGMYVFTEFDIYAARREGYELAMRKAQEGREPVGEVFLSAEDGKPVPKLYGRYANLPDGTKLYTSPPPKSDEARDAERYRWLLRNYLRFSLQDEALKHGSLDAAIDAALAAQQKGGAAS